MAKLAFLDSRAFNKRRGGPPRSPRPRWGGGRVLSVGTLVVGGVACHVGAHGGGCSIPNYHCNERTMRGEARRQDGGVMRGQEGSTMTDDSSTSRHNKRTRGQCDKTASVLTYISTYCSVNCGGDARLFRD